MRRARSASIVEQAVEPLEAGGVERVGRHAVARCAGELQALEPATVGVEPLVGRLGRAALLDRGDVALGGAQVPPAATVAVAVGGAADAEVLALRPVEEVVAALVAGPGPVRDLVPGEPGRAQPLVGDRYLSAWSSSSGWRAGSAASGVPGSTVRA